jgi:DNA polymerase III subunit delta
MPIYFFWGEDDFAIAQAVKDLEKSILDPHWIQFNYDRIDGEQSNAVIEALNQCMTPVFGMGGRLIWLAETSLCQNCPDDILAELERTLPQIPEFSHFLLTSTKKPDARLKSTKLLNQYAEVKDFSPISPWNTEAIAKRVREIATEKGVKLTPSAADLLAESVGNNTRQLCNELEKLSLFANNSTIDRDVVAQLVRCNTHNSLQLAGAIRQGKQSEALTLVNDLMTQNEPALRIIATLVGQFRTWAIIKLMMEKGEQDEKVIVTAAELSNAKRLHFLRQEIQHLKAKQLLDTLPILLELEASLKLGGEPISTLQTKVIQLCEICR